MVRDGETGILEKVGNVAAMAERAVKLLSDEESYLQMALESRRHAVNKFHVDDMVTNYLKYYEVFL